MIEPFPDHLDRRDFGNWLSGFTDGEGSFVLGFYKPSLKSIHNHAIAYFRIKLRNDDLEILKRIRSFWQCGTLRENVQRGSTTPNAKPTAEYSVSNVPELISTIIPHFERYPLLAKKGNDFIIWKRGVELMATVQSRKVRIQRPSIGSHCFGTSNKWTDFEREEFALLSQDLKARRRYPASDAPVAPRSRRQSADDQNLLF